MSSATEETLPMLDRVSNAKKQPFGLAALMVLCLALMSFVAGHAYSSAATTSAIKSSSGFDINIASGMGNFQHDLLVACYDQIHCIYDTDFSDHFKIQSCVQSSSSPSCYPIFNYVYSVYEYNNS